MRRWHRLPFRRHAPGLVPDSGWSAWLAPGISGAMAFLAVLSLAAALGAAALGAEWRANLAGAATVRVPDPGPGAVDRVIGLLETTPGVAGARPLGRDEQEALLAPWLGDGAMLSDLPVPQLIAVTLEGAGPDPAALGAELAAAAPGAVYDDHAAWRRPLIGAAAMVERLALAAMALVALTAAGVVALAARASLAGNGEVVRVIRLIGGEDAFIIRAFVRPLVWRSAAGAVLGGGVAAALLAFVPPPGAALGLSLVPAAPVLAALALAVAVVLGAIAWASSRLSVRAALRDLP